MKKKILFMTRESNSGGVERTLNNLINALDFTKVDADLVVESMSGSFTFKADKCRNVVNLWDYSPAVSLALCRPKEKIKDLIKQKKFGSAFKLLMQHIQTKNMADDPTKLFEFVSDKIGVLQEQYDLAVDFHGYGDFSTIFVKNNINAKRKASWIHDEQQEWTDRCVDYYNYYDKIFCVSQRCREVFVESHPQFENKTEVFYNIIPVEEILELSHNPADEFCSDEAFKILTVGRLERQKGYDIAIQAAKLIKQKCSKKFVWYCVGEGALKDELISMVKENMLTENMRFLGFEKNPYRIMNVCDVYVQPSRHEGFCTTISEAKIVGIPIIATNVSGVSEQIRNGSTGFIVDFDAEMIAESIMKLMDDDELRKKVRSNLQNCKSDFANELSKLYGLC